VARPVDIIHDNRHPLPGLRIWGDRLESDEIELIDDVPVTTPTRTALDLACWHPSTTSVAALDALARATEFKLADVELLEARYRGRRGLERARVSLDLVDAGAQSPKETWLRLILVRAGLPRPKTQIPVLDDFGDVLLTSIWVGKTSKSQSSMTASNIALIGDSTPGMFDGWRRSNVVVGSWCGWSREIGPPIFCAGFMPPVLVERDAAVTPVHERDCSFTLEEPSGWDRAGGALGGD
jgi:hypothetical protein